MLKVELYLFKMSAKINTTPKEKRVQTEITLKKKKSMNVSVSKTADVIEAQSLKKRSTNNWPNLMTAPEAGSHYWHCLGNQ